MAKQSKKNTTEESELKRIRRRLRRLEAENARLRRSETALRDSRATVRALLDASLDRALLVDTRGKILALNRAAARAFGTAPRRLVGKCAHDLVPARLAGYRRGIVARVVRSKKPALIENQREGRLLHTSIRPVVAAGGRVARLAVFARDITDERRAEQALRESEQRYRALFESAPVGIGMADRAGNVLAANRAMLELNRWSLEEMKRLRLGRTYVDPGRRRKLLRLLARDGRVRDFRVELKRKDGSVYTALLNVDQITLDGREVVMTISRDVTAQKRGEAELMKFKTITDRAGYGAAISDPEGNLEYVNEAFARMHGYAPEELTGKHLSVFHAPEQMPAVNRLLRRLKRQGTFVAEEVWHKGRDGSAFPSLMNATVIRDDRGRALYMSSTALDISQRKRTEEMLRASEAKYRTLAESIPAMVYAAAPDAASTTTYVSPQVERILGYTPRDYQRDPDMWRKRLHPDDRQRVLEEVARCHATGENLVSEYRIIARDGRVVWMRDEASLVRDERGKAVALQGVMLDVTDRKHAEQAEQQARRKLQQIVDNTWDIIFQIDPEGNYTFGNRAAERITGYPLERLLRMNMVELIVPEDRDRMTERLRRRVAGEALDQPFELEMITADGRRIALELTTSPVLEEGRLVGVQGIARDMTARKQAEAALRESEERYYTLVNDLPVGVFRNTPGPRGRFIMANRAMARLHGYDSVEELCRHDVADLYEDPDGRRAFSEKLIRQGSVTDEEVRLRRKDGTPIWGSVTARVVRDASGKALFFDGVLEDITERKQAEEDLRQSEQRMRLILEHSSDGINMAELDPKSQRRRLLMCNDRFVEMSGRTREELMAAEDLSRLQVCRDSSEVSRGNRVLLAKGQPFRGLASWIRPDGKENYYEWTAAPIRAGEKVLLIGVDRDITERMRAEEALRLSEGRMRLILENTTDGIDMCERDPVTTKRRLVMCNDRFVEMSGLTREELMEAEDLGALIENHTPPEQAEKNHELLLRGLPHRGLASWIRPDGKENYYEWTAAPIKVGDRQYLIGIDRDITERMRAEAAIRDAHAKLTAAREQERRRLAADLHDSVGQGLIALRFALRGLIDLYLGRHGSDAGARPVEDACGQCDALIRDVRGICHGLYPPTLELGLAAALEELARQFPGPAQVEVGCHVPRQRRFAEDVEIALFRIAQEALTNAVRHASPRRVRLELDYEDREVVLTIADDGVGFDPAAVVGKGLGLTMMQERVQAVGGKLNIDSGKGGTHIRARVPAE